MGQLKVQLKMGFFLSFLADLAIFGFLTLPSCLLSCSKQVLSIDSQKIIFKAKHDHENRLNYGRPPDHGIHPIKNAYYWAQGVHREEGRVLPCLLIAPTVYVKTSML
jgi:hypothetical protein